MNRLANETSPYLLQHADNPVDWYPWGEEAFERARTEDRPILLSVGYSACHWCHVMAHESFEDEAIAALMNEGFVNVKVDREERPDVDSVYMTFTQAMTGQGGWPMTVFLTPALEPFYAGTYFPPTDQYGRPGFPRLLESIMAAWRDNRAGVLESASTLTEQVRAATERATEAVPGAPGVSPQLADEAVAALRTVYDAEWGGFGTAPKFPSTPGLEFLLMYGARTDDMHVSGMALHTARRMAEGGMYDHLGGGFARYSVDQRWLVPHFEKMLYDNALLARLYLHAFQVTEEASFATVARETLDYLAREMRHPDGGFYAAQDADSEGIEGKFFVWTPDEIDEALAGFPDDAGLAFRTLYHVTEAGNFEDPHHPDFGRRTVLSRPRSLESVARELGRDPAEVEAALPAWRARLREVREQRVHPGLDDKVLTSWNGLAMAAFAEAARVLDEPRYLEMAVTNGSFLRERVWDGARLRHTYKDGHAHVDGLLEDYAYLALGLVEVYRATGDLAHLHWAGELFEVALERFRDDNGGFFEAPLDGEALLIRQKPFFDSPTPSGNACMGMLGITLGRYFGRSDWEQVAREVVGRVSGQFARAATGFGAMLQVVELLIAPPREIAIVGPAEARAPFEREVARRYLPTVLLAPAERGGLPLLEDRSVPDGAAAYVCENMVCDLPARSVQALREQLGE
ncbi:MAG: thioredoxin domain-containing protein [Dehalococcoidia bacterium]|nr:thioredoxin domain-containing protein [Dehalococcoidia bacterium]